MPLSAGAIAGIVVAVVVVAVVIIVVPIYATKKQQPVPATQRYKCDPGSQQCNTTTDTNPLNTFPTLALCNASCSSKINSGNYIIASNVPGNSPAQTYLTPNTASTGAYYASIDISKAPAWTYDSQAGTIKYGSSYLDYDPNDNYNVILTPVKPTRTWSLTNSNGGQIAANAGPSNYLCVNNQPSNTTQGTNPCSDTQNTSFNQFIAPSM